MGAPVTVSSDELAEVQGLYGPFQFPESLLQKIWLRREIDIASAHTQCGRRVEVIHPGRWNRLGGPDFKHARLRLNGVESTGDIELHLRAEDWRHHGHHRDPAYDQVVLHVVLWSGPDPRTEQSAGRSIPTLALLPLLLYPLEEYAADAVVERLADRACTRATEELLTLPDQERRKTLRLHAAARWKQKIRRLIAEDFQAAFAHCDLIAGPVAPTVAWKLGGHDADPLADYLADIFTLPASLAGLPGMSLPVGFGEAGMPVGLQLIGNHLQEARLLSAAHAYQQATDWHIRRPGDAT